ncbi:NANOG neighbor homeobox [Talpa occidentalis]|uniref:NANOG neighbor homeobox n=1 Tax=Talpa occidentalis TaxID=50954 RepID=UPI00188FCBA5|nr:NANOG neighbor homeobox [Talpa occidentalis]
MQDLTIQKLATMPCDEDPEQSSRSQGKDKRSRAKRCIEWGREVKEEKQETEEEKERKGHAEQYPQKRLISKPLMYTLWTKFKLSKYLTMGDRLSLAFEFSLTDKQINHWFCEKREKYKEEMYKQKYKKQRNKC